jgi:hypothetical protein
VLLVDVADASSTELPNEPSPLTPVNIDRSQPDDVTVPIVVDLGKRRRKELKELTVGEGPLVKEVADVIEQVRTELAGDLDGRVLLPVVLIYRNQRRRRATGGGPFARTDL